jgi:hypothetical protein
LSFRQIRRLAGSYCCRNPTMHPALDEGQRLQQRRRKRRRQMILLAVLAAAMGVLEAIQSIDKLPYHTSILRGQQWLIEVVNSPNPFQIKEQLGVRRHVFLSLVNQLSELTMLEDSRSVTIHEQVAIFLYTVVGNISTRRVAERFQHSTQTISNYVNSVAEALNSAPFYSKYVQLPPNRVPNEIEENPKFFPFFRDVLAAIDGSHFNATPPAEDRARYRNRKGGITQNVLLSCTFDMRFCHVLSGWEGSANDGILYDDARRNDLKIPVGKCYIADAGFVNCDSLLVPYRGVRYHLKEWGRANLR